jgi:hypothetical protein
MADGNGRDRGEVLRPSKQGRSVDGLLSMAADAIDRASDNDDNPVYQLAQVEKAMAWLAEAKGQLLAKGGDPR